VLLKYTSLLIEQKIDIWWNLSMRCLNVNVEIYKSSNDELIIEKLIIFLEHKYNIITYLISTLDYLQEE